MKNKVKRCYVCEGDGHPENMVRLPMDRTHIDPAYRHKQCYVGSDRWIEAQREKIQQGKKPSEFFEFYALELKGGEIGGKNEIT